MTTDDEQTATVRIHYAPRSPYDGQWHWPVDKSPVLACEFQTRLPPLYLRTAKRLKHSLREHTTDLDAVTCRDCRRSEAFQREHKGREDRNNEVPRHWRYWQSKRKRRRMMAERFPARYTRSEAKPHDEPHEVTMWRTRPTRVDVCPCPRHMAAHAKAIAASDPPEEDE